MTRPQEEPAKRPLQVDDRGKPTSYAAHATRKNVSVKVRVAHVASDTEELREDGYGHGV